MINYASSKLSVRALIRLTSEVCTLGILTSYIGENSCCLEKNQDGDFAFQEYVNTSL